MSRPPLDCRIERSPELTPEIRAYLRWLYRNKLWADIQEIIRHA